MQIKKEHLKIINEKLENDSNIKSLDIAEEKINVIEVEYYDEYDDFVSRVLIYKDKLYIPLESEEDSS